MMIEEMKDPFRKAEAVFVVAAAAIFAAASGAVLCARRRRPRVEFVRAEKGFKIELNSATAAELRALPGIGRVLSERIVEKRKRTGGFRQVEDLLEVKGITPERLERIRRWIEVETP